MWEKLKSMCSQIKLRGDHLIFQELFIYSKINKAKEFDKLVTNHFSEVGFLVIQLRAVIMPNRDIWDHITIIVATNTL